MFCAYCGREMTEGTAVCPGCGYEIQKRDIDTPLAGPAPAPVYTPPGLEGGNGPVYTPPVVKCPPKAAAPPPAEQPSACAAGAYGPPPRFHGGQVCDGQPPPHTRQFPQQTAPGWGVPAQTYPGAQDPVPDSQGQREPTKKKIPTKLIAIVAAVCLLVVGAVVAVFAFVRSDPAAVVRRCLNSSRREMSKELAVTRKKMGAGSFAGGQEGPLRMEMDLGIDVPGGLYFSVGQVNVRMDVLMDLSQRRADADFNFGIAGTNLIGGTLSLDDDVMAMAVPDLYDGSYGVCTSTLAEDYNKSTLRGRLGTGEMSPDASFNYFDMVDASRKAAEEPEGDLLPAEVGEMLSLLWEESTVVSSGKRAEDVNGHERVCKVYTVTIPKATARTFLKDLALYLEENDDVTSRLGSAMAQLYGASAYAGYSTDDLVYSMEEIERALSGDVVVEVFVSGGEAVALDCLLPLYEDVTVRMELGGEKYLSDAFFLEARDEHNTLVRFSAMGNHVMEGDVFSTAMEMQRYDYYEDEMADVLDMTVEYDAGRALDNFAMSMRVSNPAYYGGYMHASVAGTVDIADDRASYDLYDITLDAGGTTTTAAMTVDVTPGDAADFRDLEPVMLLDMKLMELTELEEEIQINAAAVILRWAALMY